MDTNDNEDIKIQKEIGARNWIWKTIYKRNYVEALRGIIQQNNNIPFYSILSYFHGNKQLLTRRLNEEKSVHAMEYTYIKKLKKSKN